MTNTKLRTIRPAARRTFFDVTVASP